MSAAVKVICGAIAALCSTGVAAASLSGVFVREGDDCAAYDIASVTPDAVYIHDDGWMDYFGIRCRVLLELTNADAAWQLMQVDECRRGDDYAGSHTLVIWQPPNDDGYTLFIGRGHVALSHCSAKEPAE